MASAFWWASWMVARLLSTELSLFPFWGLCFLRDGGLPDGTLLWLQMSLPLSTLGSLQGRTAPLQVMLVPQEETLEVCAVWKPPGIALAILLWRFPVPPAEQQVTCLWVHMRQLLLVASANYLFWLFLPFGCCMLEHFMHYCQAVRAVFFPSGLALKEELHIHRPLHFSGVALAHQWPTTW